MSNETKNTVRTLHEHDQIESSEPTLTAFVVRLIRRPFVFLLTAALVLAITALFYFRANKEYESRATINVAIVNSELPERLHGLIPPPNLIVEQINEEYDVYNKRQMPRTLPRLETVRLLEGVIVLNARGRSAEESQTYLEGVVKKVVNDYGTPVREAQKSQEQFVKGKRETVNEMLKKLVDLSDVITDDSTSKALIAIERERITVRAIDLEKQLLDDEYQLLVLRSRGISVVQPPSITKNGNPVTPDLRIYFALGISLSLFFAVVAVFTADLIVDVKRSLND